MNRVLVLIVAFAATTAHAFGLYTQSCLSGASAEAEQYSTTVSATTAGAAFDLSYATSATFQVTWASLTGTLDAEVTIEASNDGTNWVERPGASLVLASASGTDIIALNGTAMERYYRIHYDQNNVSGGTVTVKGVGK